jgi:hypothetical protein
VQHITEAAHCMLPACCFLHVESRAIIHHSCPTCCCCAESLANAESPLLTAVCYDACANIHDCSLQSVCSYLKCASGCRSPTKTRDTPAPTSAATADSSPWQSPVSRLRYAVAPRAASRACCTASTSLGVVPCARWQALPTTLPLGLTSMHAAFG